MYVSFSLQPQPVRLFLSVCAFLELVSLACVLFGLGDSMRNFLIAMGGFWPDLLKGGRPIYSGQPVLMFATSAILHGGPLHFLMNMLGLMWLGPIIVNRLGSNAFWLIAGLSTLGAGGIYAALSGPGGMPAIGASGVLFGFLGTVALWEMLDQWTRGENLVPLLQHGIALLSLNVALTLANTSTIAWEAHMGGFLAGVLCGLLTWRRPFSSRWT